MRSIATVLATSLAALLLAGATARAEHAPDGRAPQAPQARKAQQPEQQQKLQRVRSEIQYLRQELKRREDELAGVTHGPAAAPPAQVQQLDERIAETERELLDMRARRRYTDQHPSVRSAEQALAELRRMRQEAGGAAPQHSGQRAAAEQRVAVLRGQLERLTSMEHDLLAANRKPQPKKPPQPPMARDGRERRPAGARQGPGVEDRLARLERAVKELSQALRERETDRRRGEGREEPPKRARGGERDVDVGRLREQIGKLERVVGAEREESEGLRRVVKELEQRFHGEREEADELREMVRRMKRERGERGGDGARWRERVEELERALEEEREESEDLREVVDELEERVHGERMEAEELREMVHRLKAERGGKADPGAQVELRRAVNELEKRLKAESAEAEELRRIVRRLRAEGGEEAPERARDDDERELRGHIRGLEKRLKVEQHSNGELRERVQELQAEVKALRGKLERR